VLKNLLASGSQRLTGHESFVRAFLRCSTKVSINNSFHSRSINHKPAIYNYKVIGNVNLDRLVYLGKITIFLRKNFTLGISLCFLLFLSDFSLIYGQTIAKPLSDTRLPQWLRLLCLHYTRTQTEPRLAAVGEAEIRDSTDWGSRSMPECLSIGIVSTEIHNHSRYIG
jgi:hypothetical protein